MKKEMLINAVHHEQKRMAIVEDGKLVEFNIQMASREHITGNIYKGLVSKVERGLQAAFVHYGGKRDGFLPLRDVSASYAAEQEPKEGSQASAKQALKVGQEVLVQVAREVSERKGALLTTFISLPGRYLVLLPNKQSGGISRKIENEEDRRRLKDLVEQIKKDEGVGFIVRTAGMQRTKQEISRDYQHLLRLWKEIQKKSKTAPTPSLIYQETEFGIRSLRDYFTSDIDEIYVDDTDTFRKMRLYCKAVAPRNLKMIKQHKEKTPIFDRYRLEDQIRIIYQDRVDLKSGGYLIINPTEAMITIDVNSGRASNKRSVEETAFRANIEAAEEIARQLRLRDLGGLIVIDFIDMRDRKHEAEVEKTFKKAMSLDRSRVQLSRISKFGIMELSRQKKQSTIQEVSYTTCPHCNGRGVRPSVEYTALSAFRRIESQAVKGLSAVIKTTLPYEIADYLVNQKRGEIAKLEAAYDMSIHISGRPLMAWDDMTIECLGRKELAEMAFETEDLHIKGKAKEEEEEMETAPLAIAVSQEDKDTLAVDVPAPDGVNDAQKKKPRRRPRHRRKKGAEKTADAEGTWLRESDEELPKGQAEPPPSGGTTISFSAFNLVFPEDTVDIPAVDDRFDPQKERKRQETGSGGRSDKGGLPDLFQGN
ncbi:MAG: Rne/Rng family ribonuclease [Deltaproteobacteria bacterium]|nr:Rne/Rng family ribonuclease [Deltaproteobacteria bacterium]